MKMTTEIYEKENISYVFEQDHFKLSIGSNQFKNIMEKHESIAGDQNKRLLLHNIIDRKMRLNNSEVMPVETLLEVRDIAIKELYTAMVKFYKDYVKNKPEIEEYTIIKTYELEE